MSSALTNTTCRRLDIQGFERVDERALAQVAPWLRLAFALCAVMAGVGTAMASPMILLLLVPIASLAALFPVHPFDLIYNYGIRFVTGTSPLPRRGAPSRFACGLGAVWLVATRRAGRPRRTASNLDAVTRSSRSAASETAGPSPRCAGHSHYPAGMAECRD